MPSIIEGDCFVAGTLTARTFSAPANSVSDQSVLVNANISATKLQQQYSLLYSQASTSNATVDRKTIHRVYGATGSLVDFRIGAVTAAQPGSSVTVDLKKNGTTILTAPVVLDNLTPAYSTKSPSGYVSTSFISGDVLEIHITTVTGSDPPQGLFATLLVREVAQ